MKKKTRRPRSTEVPRQSCRTETTTSVKEEKKPDGNRGKPHRNAVVSEGTSALYQAPAAMDANYSSTDAEKHSESKPKSSGRLSTAVCRLCHGKFSPRSLRHAFNTWPQDAVDIVDDESDAGAPSPLLFHTDFQRLVGVQLDRDPRLSDFICKKCHTKFYKCHNILIRFLQRVNLPPLGKDDKSRKNVKCRGSSEIYGSATSVSLSSDPKCLHSLVSWTHQHAEACRSCPDLKEVLEGQCWGSVKAVWCCVEGHSYTMDTRSSSSNPGYMLSLSGGAAGSGNSDGGVTDDEDEQLIAGAGRTPGGVSASLVQHGPSAETCHTESAALEDWARNTGGAEEERCPGAVQPEVRPADSDLSDRAISENEFDESRKAGLSEDELFEPYSDKRACSGNIPQNKRGQRPKAAEEPKAKKKPGPKPGWKKKFKAKGEDLPNIYKCPYSGCTAVYRAPDGLKKHIKEHHEEVRERPCPHPGCNKVFMIDRYLQRHVKLIHTEERNYICDQCGQTFKQRKHLSVHQMRHSGAKPLQCEICGFQCRQRASLKYHMTKHKAEADLDFACLMCGKRFEKAHNLNVHMSMVHPLIQAKVQRGGGQEAQNQPPYTDLHAITLAGEAAQQDQDR